MCHFVQNVMGPFSDASVLFSELWGVFSMKLDHLVTQDPASLCSL